MKCGEAWLRSVLWVIAIVIFVIPLIACESGVSQSKYDKLQADFTLLQEQTTTLQDNYDQLNIGLQTVTTEKDSLQSAYNGLTSEHQSLQEKWGSLGQSYNSLKNDFTQVQKNLADTQVETASLRQQLANVQSELISARQQLETYQKTGIQVYSGTNPPYSKDGPYVLAGGLFTKPSIVLEDNQNATDPTWAQLKAFILQDETDTQSYIAGIFTCGNFAEQLHNRAEKAGIRAAFVAIEFVDEQEDAHALNAFKTTDKGLVYIDCTGQSLRPCKMLCRTIWDGGGCEWECPDDASDTVAYVAKDKVYGRLDLTDFTPLDYKGYETSMASWNAYEQQLGAYNDEVDRYNQEISGKVYYIGTAEEIRISQWEAKLRAEGEALDREREELPGTWEASGIVKSIGIYW